VPLHFSEDPMPTPAKKMKSRTTTAPKAKTTPPLPVLAISVSQIDPCPVNRDATFDIDSLAASIKANGLQEAIKVRPKGSRFEIVFGERRWRAFKKLGYPEIPATVEDLDDVRAAAVQAAENLCRKDPHPLEEAETYERLLAMRQNGKAVFTPETIAREVANRSVGHVYNRLKLTALSPELRKALYGDKISLTGAFLVARGVPTALQAEAWTKMMHYQEDESGPEELDDQGRLNTVTIKSIIEHEYSSRLEHAPFSLKDAKLVTAAGSCEACAKRSGNQPMLFDRMDPKDTCTDLPCFKSKVAAFIAREKGRVVAAGGTVLTDEESRKVFNGGTQLPFSSKWLDLDDVCFDDPKRRTWRKLLGDLCPAATLAFTSQGKPKLLAERAAVMASLKANGLDQESLNKKPGAAPPAAARPAHRDDPEDDTDPETTAATAPTTPDAGDERFKARVTRTTRERILAAIAAAAEGAGSEDNRFVQLTLETMFHGGYHNALLDAVKRRLGAKRPKNEYPPEALAKHAATLSPLAVRALLLELALGRSGYYSTASNEYPVDLARAIDVYKIDASAIEKTVTDQLSAARAARLSGAKAGST
jgi:ParB family chromosome partitioning protein